MREREIEKYFCDEVAKAGGEQRKYKTPGRTGAPDRIVLATVARCCFCEIKRKGEKPRSDQLREHARLRKLGFDVFVLDSIESVNKFIREWF
jgi:hypothetical protein